MRDNNNKLHKPADAAAAAESAATLCNATLNYGLQIHPYTYTFSLQPTLSLPFLFHNSNIHNNSNQYGETFSSYLNPL